MLTHRCILLGALLVMSVGVLGGCVAGTPPSDSAPVIMQQPTNQSAAEGGSATFSVLATGAMPLTYQWYMNGSAVGTNASAFTISNAAANQDQATVYVTVSNAKGVATSTTAKLSVTAAATEPTITTQPVGQTVTAGATATFTVVANGTAPLTYQWYLNGTAAGTDSEYVRDFGNYDRAERGVGLCESEQQRRERDQQNGELDGGCGSNRSDDYDPADGAGGNSRSHGDIYSVCEWDGAADVPVVFERFGSRNQLEHVRDFGNYDRAERCLGLCEGEQRRGK